MHDLTDQVALVTGGAQGIGFGIVMELARAGCNVVIAGRNIDKARVAAAQIEASGRQALALGLDVADEKSVAECVHASIERYSRVDILVNNAGIQCEKIGRASTAEQFMRCYDVNTLGIWRMTQALLPYFRAQGGGKIVNIASVSGRKPWALAPGYSASKAAAIHVTQTLAMQLGADGINVNAVCPGGVMTAMADPFLQDRPNLGEAIIQARLLKRALEPQDIGHAVVFLASPQARNITGQSLNVDGGLVLS